LPFAARGIGKTAMTPGRNRVEVCPLRHNFGEEKRAQARRRAMQPSEQHYLVFETANGFCGIAWTPAGITRFQLPAKSAEAANRHLLRRLPHAKPGTPPADVARAVSAARRYFAGEQTDFADLKLDLGEQTDFFERVYAAARRVEWGHTTTYGALAKELGGGPEAARDVGQAMAHNPVPLIIPCHRVLAAGGKLGGFSAPGGATAKRHMLELEGVQLAPAPPAQGAFEF